MATEAETEETHIDPTGPVAGSEEVSEAEYEAWEKGELGDGETETQETETVETATQEADETETENDGAAEGDGSEGEVAESEVQPPKKDQTPEWARKRFATLAAQRDQAATRAAEAEARAAAAEALLAARGGSEEEAPTGESPRSKDRVYTQAELDAEASRRAEQIAEMAAFDKQCNDLFQAGAKAFGEAAFDANLQNLRDAGILSPTDLGFVRDALETDAPEKVMFHLGQNPDEAMKIAGMSPTKRAVALDRLAVQLSQEKPRPTRPVSKVAPPIQPINGSRNRKEIDIHDPSISDEEAYAEFERLDRLAATGR